MAQLCGFREVAASQSEMIGHSDLIKLALLCGFAAKHFRVTRKRNARWEMARSLSCRTLSKCLFQLFLSGLKIYRNRVQRPCLVDSRRRAKALSWLMARMHSSILTTWRDLSATWGKMEPKGIVARLECYEHMHNSGLNRSWLDKDDARIAPVPQRIHR